MKTQNTWCLSLLCIERGLIPPKALALGLDSGEGLLQQQGHLTELPYLADWQDPSPRRWHQACRECSFPTCLLELHRVFMPQAPGLHLYMPSSWIYLLSACYKYIFMAHLGILASLYLPWVFFGGSYLIQHPEVKFQLNITRRRSLLERAEQFILQMCEQIVPRLCQGLCSPQPPDLCESQKHPANSSIPG